MHYNIYHGDDDYYYYYYVVMLHVIFAAQSHFSPERVFAYLGSVSGVTKHRTRRLGLRFARCYLP